MVLFSKFGWTTLIDVLHKKKLPEIYVHHPLLAIKNLLDTFDPKSTINST